MSKNTRQNDGHRKRLLLLGALTVLIMIFIFVMSATDGEKSGDLSHGFLGSLLGAFLSRVLPRLSQNGAEYDIRKYAHMFEYFCLTISSFLFFRELYVGKSHQSLRAAVFALGLCFVYACTDEWHQTFVPGRAGLFSDVMIDTAGGAIGLCLALLLVRLRMYKKQRKAN